jgi:poly(3-hydroxybutyrate) depolymerase
MNKLPFLGASKDLTTVSGISSGGYMAVQMHVVYSDMFKGAGIVAGGPFYCA